ncbi:MAG: hypothetical protein RIS94_1167 [Pseudomonadota bacterium]|jgi:Ca2+-binding RTX toxin-like protein
MASASSLFKFVVSGADITMYRDKDGTFEVDNLDANQTLTLDPATGDIVLKETYADHIEVTVFHQTADTTDDPSLYVRGSESWTTPDGTLLIQDDHDHDGNVDDTIQGSEGNDVEHGGAGKDHISGGDGADDLNGDAGDDTLDGGTGNDHLHGGLGRDIEHGGNGDDTIGGDGGNDTLTGDAGNDTLDGGAGNDRMSGGVGNDVVRGGNGDDTLHGNAGRDLVNGGNGADDVSGEAGDDHLAGGAGNDHLHGGTGSDLVQGGIGDDTLSGDGGKDTLSGGDGADTFVFATGDSGATRLTADRIIDFSHAQGDHIDLSAIDADTTADGDQAFNFIGTSAFGSHAGELRYDVVDGKAWLAGDTNGDGTADFTIRLNAVTTLDATDFVL